MYLLKFKPILKTTLWGGNRIQRYKNIPLTHNHVGESWELSAIRNDESIVASGPWSGLTISELINMEKGRLMGDSLYKRFGTEFPLLIKFIDTQDDLSIQVHPDNQMARKYHNTNGKSEMWYVIDATPEATLYSGFARQLTPAQYEAAVANNTITETLQQHKIKRGDIFFLPAGRIHSIGAGALIAEIQQTSDITYRIYDFNRKGSDGKPRELHTERAREALDYTVHDDYRTHYTPQCNHEVEIICTPHFTTSLYELDKLYICDYSQLDSFVAVICTEGGARLSADDGEAMEIRAGETILVPAATHLLRIEPTPSARLLTSYIKQHD